MLFEMRDQLWPFGVGDRDEILDPHGVEHLPAKTFGDHAGTNTLARGIDRSGRTGRAATDHQHIERVLGGDLFRGTRHRSGVKLGHDLGQVHAPLPEHFAIEEHGRHGHDLAAFDFILEQRAVDCDMAGVGVERGDHVQRLHHVGAVLA